MQHNQCFAVFQRRRLCDDVFSTLVDKFGDFGAVSDTALIERNQTIGCKKHGGISAYRKASWIFDDEFLKKKNGGNMIFTVFYYLNFLDIECYN